MDILQILRKKIELLPQGDSLIGINAVISHIEVAEKYLLRAQAECIA